MPAKSDHPHLAQHPRVRRGRFGWGETCGFGPVPFERARAAGRQTFILRGCVVRSRFADAEQRRDLVDLKRVDVVLVRLAFRSEEAVDRAELPDLPGTRVG